MLSIFLFFFFFFFLMIRRPPRSTLFPTRRSSDLIRSAPLLGTAGAPGARFPREIDRKSTRLNSSHVSISYAVFCLKKKKKKNKQNKKKKKKKKKKKTKKKKKKKQK